MKQPGSHQCHLRLASGLEQIYRQFHRIVLVQHKTRTLVKRARPRPHDGAFLTQFILTAARRRVRIMRASIGLFAVEHGAVLRSTAMRLVHAERYRRVRLAAS